MKRFLVDFTSMNCKKSKTLECIRLKRYERVKLIKLRDNFLFFGYDTTLILILELPVKTITIPNDFYVTLKSNVFDPSMII